MSLIRWEPFTGTDDLFARMPSMFGRWPRAFEFNGNKAFEWSPSVDISETDGEFLIRADLPAVKKRLTDMASDPLYMDPAETDRFIGQEFDRWGPVVKAADVKPE